MNDKYTIKQINMYSKRLYYKYGSHVDTARALKVTPEYYSSVRNNKKKINPVVLALMKCLCKNL